MLGCAPPSAIPPFDAKEAKAHQEARVAYLKVPVEHTNSIGMRFRLIPPGEFMMGGPPEEIEKRMRAIGDNKILQDRFKNEVQHKVILTRPCYLGAYEVTQKEYTTVVGNNPSHFSKSGLGKELVSTLDTQNHPVENVRWSDAADFCVMLSKSDALKPNYIRSGETVKTLEGTGYRLLTEAEWEFA